MEAEAAAGAVVVAAVKMQNEPERKEDSALEGLSEAQRCHNCICRQKSCNAKLTTFSSRGVLKMQSIRLMQAACAILAFVIAILHSANHTASSCSRGPLSLHKLSCFSPV